ncbi:type I polyketide synthase [Kitasatospora sp. NPDC089913]|uniref:type I polyketide synthase n=1 Tax=Kitasatospora sp. NPDC089913 TaxID=3364080 RepID=UPI00382548EA
MQLDDAVAVVGLSGRFPGADSPTRFWENIQAGRESLTRLTTQQLAAAGVTPEEYRHDSYVPVRGVLDDVDLFDAELFGYPPREAELMDPQQRLLLQCARTALEEAGHGAGGGRVGVFVGTSMSSYLLHHLLRRPELEEDVGLLPIMVGNDKEHAATRIAYRLGLTGPALAVQTACSTSLVAVHYAARSVLHGECDLALAGGASITLPQHVGYRYQRHGILSPDGRCRAFDRRAAGTVAGSGVGVVLLKRALDAQRDGDVVHALIRGSAVNNDGGDKVGYTAPSVAGQTAVIRAALRAAGITPAEIDYVETHGTGTELGDGIEIAALTAAFRDGPERRGDCAIGSLKPNIGHLDAAAGIASFIKAVLALKHRVLPPSINCEEPNPDLRLEESPFRVNREARPWPSSGAPRRCGVSSFGIGGTNAHVVLEEAPPAAPPAADRQRPAEIVVQSARTREGVLAAGADLVRHLDTQRPPLGDIAHTLQTGRAHLEWRRAVTVSGLDGLGAALDAAAVRQVPRSSSLVLQFPGQGSQYAGMAAGLHREIPQFRTVFDHCLTLLEPRLAADLDRLLTPDRPTADDAAELRETRLAQPALFVTQYALAQVLTGWGLRPKALLGHSVGEYTAACLAGAMSLEDSLRLVAARGDVMARAPRGTMLAVLAPEPAVRSRLDGTLSVAAVNAPSVTVVGGTVEEVDALARRLAAEGTATRALRVGHAFHTALMAPVLEEFRALAGSVTFSRLRIPVVSNVTGDFMNRRRGHSADYWTEHLREPVRYADGLARVLALPSPIVLEVGPGRALTGLALQQDAAGRAALATTMPRPAEEPADAARMLFDAVGTAWSAGATVDWAAHHAGAERRRVPLPTYRFTRTRHWIDAPGAVPRTTTGTPPDAPVGTATDAAVCTEIGTAVRPAAPAEAPTAGSTHAESALTGIWSRLLGTRGIGPDSDFFELGGHSLLAVSLLTGIQETFGVELSLNDTYRARTLGAQATLITNRRGEDAGVPDRRTDSV